MANIPSYIDPTFFEKAQQVGNPSRFAPDTSMGQQDFLRLLATQMMNQDPTKPMDPTSFVTDLTQMSQLEATQQLNKSMDLMTTGFKNLQVMQASSLIGRSVVAESDAFNHYEDTESHIGLVSDEPLSDVRIVISNGKGVVRELSASSQDDLGNKLDYLAAGESTILWDGLNSDGGEAAPGVYNIVAYGYDANGDIKGIKTQVAVGIYSVSLEKDGGMKLTLSTGKKVDMDAVKEIG